jgi:CDP-diacylglycerol--glycerol-3-phosphate 3-phosphatidyltransferase
VSPQLADEPSAAASQDAGASTPKRRATGPIRYVPNALTILRLLCLPIFFWLYGMQAPGFAWKAASLMFVAALTDLADGYIARRYNATSELGRLLDPVVDRAFFITILAAYIYYGTMPWWAAAPVLARDVVLMATVVVLFGRAAERPQVMKLGKWANFVLAWGVGFFMIGVRVVAWPIYVAGATLYLVSGALYIARFFGNRRRAAA